MAKSILKWPGGKAKMLPLLRPLIQPLLQNAKNYFFKPTYFEPFLGGGSVAFDLEYDNSVISDLNPELMNVYEVVKSNPEELIAKLSEFQKLHSTEFYYIQRDLDRTPQYSKLSNIEKAARTLYLNKTCFNGLYRVNSEGYFNSPIGRTSTGKTPDIVQEDKIRNLSNFISKVTLKCGSYLDVLKQAKAGDIIFLDPPYTYTYTGYTKEGFSKEDTEILKAECDRLTKIGCYVIVTNADNTFIRDLFKDYTIIPVNISHSINRDGNNRKASEVILLNKLFSL